MTRDALDTDLRAAVAAVESIAERVQAERRLKDCRHASITKDGDRYVCCGCGIGIALHPMFGACLHCGVVMPADKADVLRHVASCPLNPLVKVAEAARRVLAATDDKTNAYALGALESAIGRLP